MKKLIIGLGLMLGISQIYAMSSEEQAKQQLQEFITRWGERAVSRTPQLDIEGAIAKLSSKDQGFLGEIWSWISIQDTPIPEDYQKQMRILSSIINKGLDVNQPLSTISASSFVPEEAILIKDNETTPLRLAIVDREKDIVALLLEQGANVNAADSDGNTPLHIASASLVRGDNKQAAEIIKLLIKYGAQQTAKNKAGQMPLEYAVNL